jgi:tetratricopeptide (TPR) repeat protein
MSSSSIRFRFITSVLFVVALACPAMGQRVLQPVGGGSAGGTAIPVPEGPSRVGHWYYGPGGYSGGSGYSPYSDGVTQERAFGIGRRTERSKYNAFEAERRLDEYRYRRGLPHPYPHEYPDSGFSRVYGSPWDSFHTYGQELEHYRQREQWAREELTYLTQHDYLVRGLSEFRAGNYASAARSLRAATELNHGDSASRIHAGQALVATGVYDEAAKHFRRGFELRIRLLNVPFNLQADYGRKTDYVEHVAQLESYCRSHPGDGPAWLVLAIERFFGPDPGSAREAMLKVEALFPKDAFATRLVEAAKPVMGSDASSSSQNGSKVEASRRDP